MAPFLLFLLSIADDENEEKIAYLFNTYYHELLRFTRSRLAGAGLPNYTLDGEDVVQNTFVNLARVSDRIDMDNNVKSYIMAILVNEISDFVRKEKKNAACVDCLDDYPNYAFYDDFVNEFNIKEEYDRVMKAIDEMQDIYKITLMCRYQKDMTPEQIAEFFQAPVKTVYTRLARGREAVIRTLKEEDEKNGTSR